MKGWSIKGISIIVSGLEKPLHADPMTKDRTRLGCAFICVKMHVPSSFLKYIKLDEILDELKGEPKVAHLPVKYQWVPSICSHFYVFGCHLSQYPQLLSQPLGEKS